MYTNAILLFHDRDLSTLLVDIEQSIFRSIDNLNPDQILNSEPEKLALTLLQQYELISPALQKDAKQQSTSETTIKGRDFGRDTSIPGVSLAIYIPYSGNGELFMCRPSLYSSNPPHGAIIDQEVILTYKYTNEKLADAQVQLEKDVASIEWYLDNISKDLTDFTAKIIHLIQEKIDARRNTVLATQKIVADMRIPSRHPNKTSSTYVVPITRQQKFNSSGDIPTIPLPAEPVLELSQYNEILFTLASMSKTMEANPQTFRKLGEEDIRNHFLSWLNGNYKQHAIGETFRNQGKTDIIIVHDGKCIFVAECKFWNGANSLLKAIDQLLRYITWRDTKTAILLFNRTKNFSSVLQKIPEVVETHPNYKTKISHGKETEFRYIFHHPDDQERDLILTILAFELPK